MDFSFKKEERLHKRKQIEHLFAKGNSFFQFPFKVIHCELQDEEILDDLWKSPLKIAFSIPKKRFKLAVDRNRLKRQSKEAYRLNRISLRTSLKKQEKKLLVMLVYSSSESLKYADLQDKIILILQRLQDIYAENRP